MPVQVALLCQSNTPFDITTAFCVVVVRWEDKEGCEYLGVCNGICDSL